MAECHALGMSLPPLKVHPPHLLDFFVFNLRNVRSDYMVSKAWFLQQQKVSKKSKNLQAKVKKAVVQKLLGTTTDEENEENNSEEPHSS